MKKKKINLFKEDRKLRRAEKQWNVFSKRKLKEVSKRPLTTSNVNKIDNLLKPFAKRDKIDKANRFLSFFYGQRLIDITRKYNQSAGKTTRFLTKDIKRAFLKIDIPKKAKQVKNKLLENNNFLFESQKGFNNFLREIKNQ